MLTEQTMERAEDCAVDICHELNIDDNEFNICNIADQIVKHFPPSVPVKERRNIVDAARHAANGIPWGDGTPEDRIKRRQEYQDRIADAFHDFVPVSRLERLLKLSDVFVWNTANWTTAIRNLIAEAK